MRTAGIHFFQVIREIHSQLLLSAVRNTKIGSYKFVIKLYVFPTSAFRDTKCENRKILCLIFFYIIFRLLLSAMQNAEIGKVFVSFFLYYFPIFAFLIAECRNRNFNFSFCNFCFHPHSVFRSAKSGMQNFDMFFF